MRLYGVGFALQTAYASRSSLVSQSVHDYINNLGADKPCLSKPMFSKLIQIFGEFPIAFAVGVDLVGFQVCAQNFRPRAAEQRNAVFLGQILIQRMVAQMPEQRAQCDVRHADEDGGNVFLARFR